jgi:hypothetical protein
MAEISLWSAAIIVMLMMFAASIGFVAAAILAGARSDSDVEESNQIQGPSHAGAAISGLASSTETTIRNTSYIIPSSRKSE